MKPPQPLPQNESRRRFGLFATSWRLFGNFAQRSGSPTAQNYNRCQAEGDERPGGWLGNDDFKIQGLIAVTHDEGASQAGSQPCGNEVRISRRCLRLCLSDPPVYTSLQHPFPRKSNVNVLPVPLRKSLVAPPGDVEAIICTVEGCVCRGLRGCRRSQVQTSMHRCRSKSRRWRW